MKSLLLLGGLLGFLIGLGLSWAQQSPWPSCLWHACVAAYLSGLVLKWWGNSWRRGLEQAFEERQNMPPRPVLTRNSSGGK
jgi:hypothetical protein